MMWKGYFYGLRKPLRAVSFPIKTKIDHVSFVGFFKGLLNLAKYMRYVRYVYICYLLSVLVTVLYYFLNRLNV